MNYSYAIHTLGLVFWIGGLLFGCKIIKVASEDSQAIQVLARKTAFGYIVPGLAITLLTGLHQLVGGGMAQYMKQGWMHAKLTLVAILLWSTFAIFMNLIAISKGEKGAAKTASIHHGLVSLILVVGLILVFAKPF